MLYNWQALINFIQDCLGKDRLYIYEDPVSNMIVNVLKPGSQFNWHFDTNEFTITMLLKSAVSGGHFEYVPNLRNANDECYEDVRAVLRGDPKQVTRLNLAAGDLQLFLGRFSLHRVTKNTGLSDRLLLIMSFAEKPGMIGSVERTRELYGKVTDRHLEAQTQRELLLQEFLDLVMNDVEVLVLPVSYEEAPIYHEKTSRDAEMINQEFAKASIFTRFVNFLGLPAVSLPTGLGPSGLPTAVQLIAKPFEETTMLSIASEMESVFSR